MTVHEQLVAVCCGDEESGEIWESLLHRDHVPAGTGGEPIPSAVVSMEQTCPRCGWKLDSEFYCAFCSEVSTRPVARGGWATAAPATEEAT